MRPATPRALESSPKASSPRSAIGTPADPVKQLSDSRCVDLSEGRGGNFYCLLTAGRYAIEAQSGQLLDAQQKAAAQYAMLLAP